MTGLLKRGMDWREDVAEQPVGLPQLAQDVGGSGRVRAVPDFVFQAVPVAALGDLDAALVGHLQEEQVGELLDVVAVIDAVVAERVAEAPEFVDDVGHGRVGTFLKASLLRDPVKMSLRGSGAMEATP